jgi:hypothetical protein
MATQATQHWHTVENTSGYMPDYDGEPHSYESRADATDAIIDDVTRYIEDSHHAFDAAEATLDRMLAQATAELREHGGTCVNFGGTWELDRVFEAFECSGPECETCEH